jgi:predicted transcriptional regulator
VSEDIDLRNRVADVAAAYFRNSQVVPSEIPTVIQQIAASLSPAKATDAEAPPETPAQPALGPAQIRKSITRNALISFEDGKPYKTLRRHLAARGLSPDKYRSKWGLPKDYPMTAPSYSEARASLAKARGLGGSSPSKVALPEPTPDTATTAPAPPPVPTADAPKPSPRGLALSKNPSPPSAFRPRAPVSDLETGVRHKRWLAMLSETDWARIRAVARQVNHAHVPAALTDLSAPLRVRMCLVGREARFPGEYVGTLRDGQVVVLISEPDEH